MYADGLRFQVLVMELAELYRCAQIVVLDGAEGGRLLKDLKILIKKAEEMFEQFVR